MGHGVVAPNNSQAGAGAVNDFDDFSGFDDPFADPSADPFVTDDLSFMEHGSTINGGLGYGGLFDSDYSSMNYDLSLDQGQPTDGHQPQGPAPFFAPFLLTGYPFALQYLALKHEVLQQAAPMLAALAQQGAQEGYHGSLTNYSCPVAIRRCLEIAKTLIVGLNRAFTNLMLIKVRLIRCTSPPAISSIRQLQVSFTIRSVSACQSTTVALRQIPLFALSAAQAI